MNRRSFLALLLVLRFASRFEQKGIAGTCRHGTKPHKGMYFKYGTYRHSSRSVKLKPGTMLNIPAGRKYHAGSIVFHPSPADLDLWLPRILGR